jgi:hypothetical protein
MRSSLCAISMESKANLISMHDDTTLSPSQIVGDVTRETYLSLEESAVVEQFFHGHVRDDRAGLTLDDTFHDILDMVAPCGDGSRALLANLAVGVASEKYCVLLQRRLIIVRSDGEDSGHCNARQYR